MPQRQREEVAASVVVNVNVCHGYDPRMLDALQNIANAIVAHAHIMQEGFRTMSEEAQNLTNVVNQVVEEFQAMNSTLDTEMTQIVEALSNAGDAELRQAANESVQRLSGLLQGIQTTRQRISEIVPDAPAPEFESNQ